MEPEEYRSLEQLKTAGNYNYRIKVMVSRKWNGSFYNKHGWNGIHMLILDNKVNFLFLDLVFFRS